MGRVPYDGRPEIIGPGWWAALHALAYVCDTSAAKDARQVFVDNALRGIGQHFPCLHCRAHAVEYMNRTDPVRDLTTKKPSSCLAWSHRFHDAVNDRLKKKPEQRPTLVELSEFLAGLREGRGCNECGAVGDVKTATVEKPPVELRRQLVD